MIKKRFTISVKRFFVGTDFFDCVDYSTSKTLFNIIKQIKEYKFAIFNHIRYLNKLEI